MPKPRKPKKLTLKARSELPEPLTAASPERDLCQECGAYQNAKTPFMPAYVPPGWTGEVLAVGERPGQDEDRKSRRPFTGNAGRALAEMLAEAGYPPEAVALTNTVRCADPENAEPNMKQIRCCRPFLLEEIRLLQPRVVIGLGTVAACALHNDGQVSVTGARGRVIDMPGLVEPAEPTPPEDSSPGPTEPGEPGKPDTVLQ